MQAFESEASKNKGTTISNGLDEADKGKKKKGRKDSAAARRRKRRPVLDQDAKEYTHVFPKFHNIFTMCHEKEVAGGVVDVESALKFHLKVYQHFVETMKDYEDIFIPESTSVQLEPIDEEDGDEAKKDGGPAHEQQAACLHWARDRFFRCQVRRRAEVGSIVKFGLERFNCHLKEHAMPCWRELPKEIGLKATYNLLWSWSRPRGLDRKTLLSWQRVNHFPGARAITRKDELKKNLQRYTNVRILHVILCYVHCSHLLQLITEDWWLVERRVFCDASDVHSAQGILGLRGCFFQGTRGGWER